MTLLANALTIIDMIEVNFYRTDDGKCPVEDYLQSLSDKQAAKVLWTFNLLRTLTPVPGQYFQKMSGRDDLWEVRVLFAGDIFRLLGFYDRDGKFLLCHGFTKKTQKTPSKEMEVAEARKAEYEKRVGKKV